MQNELQQLLTDLAAERVALIERHEAGARVVSHYDFNNTYQYVIAREETHLGWLGDALTELGAAMPKASASLPVPAIGKVSKKVSPMVAARFAQIEALVNSLIDLQIRADTPLVP